MLFSGCAFRFEFFCNYFNAANWKMDTNNISHNIDSLITTNKLVQALKERVLFLDGGLATQLEEKGIVLHRILW